MIAEKCKRKINADTWDGDNATWHITENGIETLCGVRIGKERDGWFRYNYSNKQVSCKRCAKRAGIPTSN